VQGNLPVNGRGAGPLPSGSAQPAHQTDLVKAGPNANNAPSLADPPAGEPLRALPGEVPAARGGHRPLRARGDRDRGLLEERGLARPGRVRGRAPRRPVPSAPSLAGAGDENLSTDCPGYPQAETSM
jgi:hypothetical protein